MFCLLGYALMAYKTPDRMPSRCLLTQSSRISRKYKQQLSCLEIWAPVVPTHLEDAQLTQNHSAIHNSHCHQKSQRAINIPSQDGDGNVLSSLLLDCFYIPLCICQLSKVTKPRDAGKFSKQNSLVKAILNLFSQFTFNNGQQRNFSLSCLCIKNNS